MSSVFRIVAASTSTPTDHPGRGHDGGVEGTELPGHGVFVLYYGDPLGPDGTRIRDARPDVLVVGAGLEARADIPAFYRAAGVRVIAYIAMGYGRNDVDEPVRTAMSAGYDGVFFDETDSARHAYNRACASLVKACAGHKLVVMNPGRASVDPSIFEYADVVCTENQWNQPVSLPGIPAWRWLAVQGDPAHLAADSLEDAARRLATFRANGGYWYYSPPYAESGVTHHVLPAWFEEFVTVVRGGIGTVHLGNHEDLERTETAMRIAMPAGSSPPGE